MSDEVKRSVRWQDSGWKFFVRGANAITTRTIGKNFQEFMAAGCPIVERVDGAEGIALTFDDGPHPKTTTKILDALDRCGVSATFFCVGENARRYPSLLRELVDRGHDVGNHSMHHVDMHRLRTARVRSEVVDCQSLLEDILGRRTRYFRAPWGHFRWELASAQKWGIDYLVGWDVAHPWFERDSRVVEAFVSQRITRGSIVLMHDYHFDQSLEQSEASIAASAGALSGIHGAAAAKGIPFRTLSQQLRTVAAQFFLGDAAKTMHNQDGARERPNPR